MKLFPIKTVQDKSRPLGFDPMNKTKSSSNSLGHIMYFHILIFLSEIYNLGFVDITPEVVHA